VRLRLVTGDISRIAADAIVNAANESLLGGGGVDGAIHRAGGPAILEECRHLGGCRPGEAKATTAGRLPARYVVHTVGPRYFADPQGAPAVLAAAYRSALAVAEGAGCASVAFPSISTGAFGYPLDAAARVALRAVVDYVREGPRPAPVLQAVTFVLYDDPTRDAYAAALGDVLGAEG
jgi:O-acetyl-ADP-ribose deacetylase (regulator of RNase III)